MSSAKDAPPVHVNDGPRHKVILNDEHDTFRNFVRGSHAWDTGVVSGERGFVHAFQRKVAEIKPWLSDESELVRKIANDYILETEKRIAFEKKRSDDDLVLRKHKFGVGTDEK